MPPSISQSCLPRWNGYAHWLQGGVVLQSSALTHWLSSFGT